MGSITIIGVLCVIQFVVSSKGLEISGHKKSIEKYDASTEVSYLAPDEDFRQAVELATNLRTIQFSAQNFTENLEGSVENVLMALESLFQTATNRWTALVERILALGTMANNANNECLLTQTPLANLTFGFKSDLFDCLENSVNRITDLGHGVNVILWRLNSLIKRTEFAVGSCIGSNLVIGLLCSTEYLPDLIFSTLSLLLETISEGLDLLTLLPVLIIRSIGCTAESLASRTRQAASIDVTTVRCVVNDFKPMRPRSYSP